MPTIAVRLDPALLDNPDLDIRYALPDLLVARSNGSLTADGHDFVGSRDYLILYLRTDNMEKDLSLVVRTVEEEQVLQNRLSDAAVVGVDDGSGYRVIFPPAFNEAFPG